MEKDKEKHEPLKTLVVHKAWPLTKVLSSVLPGAQSSKLPPSRTSISVHSSHCLLHSATCHAHTSIHHCPPSAPLSISHLTIAIPLHSSISVPSTQQSIRPSVHPSTLPFFSPSTYSPLPLFIYPQVHPSSPPFPVHCQSICQ